MPEHALNPRVASGQPGCHVGSSHFIRRPVWPYRNGKTHRAQGTADRRRFRRFRRHGKGAAGELACQGGADVCALQHRANLFPSSRPHARVEDDEDEEEDDEDDELDLDDDDDEDLTVYTAREAAGAVATIYAFIRPSLGNYRKALTFVGIGLLVETLFNVIMPLSLKFLIDDALGEEDFGVLVKILSALAVAGIITSLISIWYERWDAWLSSSIISDVRLRLFNHVQDLPSAFFARTKRGEILSRFSVDLSAFEGATETLANTALLPAMELIAGIILMLFLNWQLAVVALLIFPITLIGPRILTPKAVQANYEQKVNESAILGVVQENIAAQALVKAFSLQRRARGWFSIRNEETGRRSHPRRFCRAWWSGRSPSPCCCCTSWFSASAPILRPADRSPSEHS